jgi:hypothetical protein
MEPKGRKTKIKNTISEQVNTFTYLGCEFFYQGYENINSNKIKYLQILGILNNALIPYFFQITSILWHIC